MHRSFSPTTSSNNTTLEPGCICIFCRMGLKGKLIAEFEAKASGDLFHETMIKKPHHISKISPAHIQGCELHEGEFGKNGSVIFWNYTINGKKYVSKQVVENIDEVNKTLTFKEIDGDLLKSYKNIAFHLHVKPETGDIELVNWTIEYEKIHEDVPHPISLLEMVLTVSEHIDNHHHKA